MRPSKEAAYGLDFNGNAISYFKGNKLAWSFKCCPLVCDYYIVNGVLGVFIDIVVSEFESVKDFTEPTVALGKDIVEPSSGISNVFVTTS